MVRALGLSTLVVLIAVAVSNTVVSQSPGTQVPESESALVIGGDCYRIGTSVTSYLCYGGNCSSGGCGCTSDTRIVTPNGFNLQNATPCGNSIICTDRHTTDQNACSSS